MKMKQLARRYVYWPKIDSDIEKIVKGCEDCSRTQSNPPKVPVHHWEEPEENWNRIHLDYAGPIDGCHLLICVDAKSKWSEVRISRNAPTTESTISLLEDIFSIHGYPKIIVSDNATIFTSDEFRKYTKTRGVLQKLIAPGHPATNGLAERNVQTIKRRLKAAANDPAPLQEKLRSILFRYRATPLANGKTPAELYLNRSIRIRLDAIKPNFHEKSSTLKDSVNVRSFQKGERVQVRVHMNNKDVWQFGTIEEVLGKLHYTVLLDTGRMLKRHVDQMKSTLVPKKTVRVALPQPHQIQRAPILPTNQQPEIPAVARESSPQHPIQTPPRHSIQTPVTHRPQRQRRVPFYFQDYTTHTQ